MTTLNFKEYEQKYGWLLIIIALIAGPVGWAVVLLYLVFKAQGQKWDSINKGGTNKKHTGVFKHIKAANEQITQNKPSYDIVHHKEEEDLFANTYLREIIFVLAVLALIGFIAYTLLIK